ncbi:MAG: DUF5071 domain-containing protein [Ruminococcaceae bacterium]|nr:DUF5071 domain-containing protein [Oscillospiraceae bacterium]
MSYGIDEIYRLFMWDMQLSHEENEANEQKGIEAAKQIQNLFPFMQPIVVTPGQSKVVWEPCAKVVSMRSDEELEPFIFKLLEWIADPNWPGALIIYERLTRMPYASIESYIRTSCVFAERKHDSGWLSMLKDLDRDMRNGQNSWKD